MKKHININCILMKKVLKPNLEFPHNTLKSLLLLVLFLYLVISNLLAS